jgi:transmembrane sensor
MNPSPAPISPAIDTEAALWAARLEGGTLDAADRNALDAWLAASPAQRAALSLYCQFSADLEVQLPALVAAGRVALPAPAPRRSWSLKLVTASAFAAVAAIALTVVLTRPAAPEAHATAVAQRQTITLADGTRIELNARTQLTVALGSAERRVRLASGEAFFQVAKDASRPFHVETPAGSVRVTGTAFNVLAESASTLDVTVLEGSVAVSPAASTGARGTPFALTASDHLSLRPGSGGIVNKLSAATLANTLAWRQGAVIFDDVPLAAALARFAHYHDRRITASPDVADLRISARFELDDLDGFFASLAELKNVRAVRDASGAYVVSLRSQK